MAATNEELYELAREAAVRLRANGEAERAERLDTALAGATSGEVFGSLRHEFRQLAAGRLDATIGLEDEIAVAVAAIDTALGGPNRG